METPQQVFPSIIKFAPCRYCSGKFSMNLQKSKLKIVRQLLDDKEFIETWEQPINETSGYLNSFKFELGLMADEAGDLADAWQVDRSQQFSKSVNLLSFIPNYSPIVFHASLQVLGNVSSIE